MEMSATSITFNRIGPLVSADTVALGTADGLLVALFKEPFTPSRTTDVGDSVQADFDGSGAIIAGAAPMFESIDPSNGDLLVTIKPPAGGFRWETTGVTHLPMTIYGYMVRNQDDDRVYCSGLLDPPVVLDGVNQEVNLGEILLRVASAAVA